MLACIWEECTGKCDRFEQVGDYDNYIVTVCSDCLKKDLDNGDCFECAKCKYKSYDYTYIRETSWGAYWCRSCVEEDMN